MYSSVTVLTCANIALCKYWGKRDQSLMLPTKSSLSLSLASLKTQSSVSLHDGPHDIIIIDDKNASEKEAQPIKLFLETFRREYSTIGSIRLVSYNTFAHSAGMASSASGFSALAIGLNQLFNLGFTQRQLALLARRGSGSACRSIYGGFVYWQKGIRDDGLDSFAQQIAPASHWPELRFISVVVSTAVKKISSRAGMQLSVNTSTYYQSWVAQSERHIPLFIEAIKNKNFTLLGELTEAEWTSWTQVLTTTVPALSYLMPESESVIETVKYLRSTGLSCYYTTDAGPNVHILCLQKDVAMINSIIRQLAGVKDTIVSPLAEDPLIIEAS